jgi:hypothetical protein
MRDMANSDTLYGEALRQYILAIKASAVTMEEIRKKLPFYAFFRRAKYGFVILALNELFRIGVELWTHVDMHVHTGECPDDPAN